MKKIAAILGGDARELRVAERLMEIGFEVRIFGLEKLPNPPVSYSPSAEAAVDGAHWIIAPAPGINGDAIFSPFAGQSPILLVESLMAKAKLQEGGLILGRASKSVQEASEKLGFLVVESKDERHLAIANSTTVAEGLIRLLIEKTNRNLRDYKYVLTGYGATGVAITDLLLAMKCRVEVVTRNLMSQERAHQLGATITSWEQRVEAMKRAEIIINTAPDTETIPASAFSSLVGRIVFDIASPPGGLDHSAVEASGLNVVWARGLGNRAPVSSGDIRFGFIKQILDRYTK